MSKRSLFTLAPIVFATLVGCTPERGPIGHLKIPGELGTDYRIGPDGISDARLSISRVDNTHEFRGFVRGINAEVEARAEADMIKGTRGSVPINVKVVQTGNEITAVGFYGSKQTAIHILHEPQGSCAFRYDEREGAHEANTCNGQRSLPIPHFMGTWPKEEQALFITIAFAEIFNGPTQMPNGELPGSRGTNSLDHSGRSGPNTMYTPPR